MMVIFEFMTSGIPISKLIRMGLIACPSISLFALLGILVKGESLSEMLWRIGIVLFTLVILWLTNIGILLFASSNRSKLVRRVYRYITSYLFATLIFILINLAITYLENNAYLPKLKHEHPKINLLTMSIIQSLLVNTIVLIFQNFILLQDAKTNSELENSRLKTANMEAVNLLLRQQIHPHFLFNALNTLKSLIKKHPQLAEEYVVWLSNFLRASVSTNNTGIVQLKDEVKLCLDYLEMQKMRLGEALQYAIHIHEEKLMKGYVPAFSLQPLLENAIKHNVLTDELPLYITIEHENERVKVTNNLQLKHVTEASTGSGLANLSERYKILSGSEIIILDTGKTFSVSIQILSNGNNNHRG